MTIIVREKFVIQAPGILLVNECARAQHRILNTKALTRESRALYIYRSSELFKAILQKRKIKRIFNPLNYDSKVE